MCRSVTVGTQAPTIRRILILSALANLVVYLVKLPLARQLNN